MMLPELFHNMIKALDETELTELMGRLLSEEARALELGAEQFVYSQQVKAADEGLDAKATDVPKDASRFLPNGQSGWQFKAVRGSLNQLRLATELKKKGPKSVLDSGGTYLVVWNKDLNDAQLTKASEKLQTEAKKVSTRKRPKTVFWAAAQIAQLCSRYPGVPFSMGLWRPGHVWNFTQWSASLQRRDRPFTADENRAGVIERLRDLLRESSGGLVARIAGDSGLGKTRTVAEALDLDEFRDATFYAPAAEGLEDFLQLVVQSEAVEVVLVVDEVVAEDHGALQARVDAAGGRIRLITIGLGQSYRTVAGRLDLELNSLDAAAMAELVKTQADITDAAASFVAEATEGYPQMAFEILAEVQASDEQADLSKLARTTKPQELMKKAVPEDFRPQLAVLALFHSVGYRDEMEYQLDALVEHFDPSKQAFLRTIENANNRYIRLAGRQCYVRPKLVATWLAGELIDQLGDQVIEMVNRLPGGLQDAFAQRFEEFGSGEGSLRRVIANFLKQSDRFSDPPGFDKAAARFLRAAAAVAPQEVVGRIHQLVHAASPEQLVTLPRRDIVWALEYLLWWEDTWEQAIESLFRLASYENETWANNATGEFVEAFQVLLGGTLVPHSVRLSWLRRQLGKTTDRTSLKLIADAAAAGLRTHVSRMGGAFRGQLEPTDWRPANRQEDLEARAGSWRVLVELLEGDDGAVVAHATAQLTKNTRTAVYAGLLDLVDETLRGRTWPADARADFAGQLRNVLRYDEAPGEIGKRVQRLVDFLSGSDFEATLTVLFETKSWDLIEDAEYEKTPPVIDEMTDAVLSEPSRLGTALSAAESAPDEGSAFAFFATLADKIGPDEVGEAALDREPPGWVAVSASLARADARSQERWADDLLQRVLDNPTWIASFPELMRAAPLNERRAQLVVEAIEAYEIPGSRFASLLYGAKIRELDWPTMSMLLRAIGSDETPGALEAVLRMLHQWIEVNPERKDDAGELFGELAVKAAAVKDPSSMLDHYLGRLLSELPLPFELKAEVWRAEVHAADVGTHDEEDHLIDALLEERPEQATDLILQVLTEAVTPPYQSWAFWIEGQDLLSRAAAATDPGDVWAKLAQLEHRQLIFLLRHFRWSGNEPDPLVRTFLVSDSLKELGAEASVNFFNTMGVVSGPLYLGLERELRRAKSWRESLAGTSAVAWADELVHDYERQIPREKEREEEEDLRLG